MTEKMNKRLNKYETIRQKKTVQPNIKYKRLKPSNINQILDC